jgi:iron complex transport system substrate-binding protein
MWARIFIFSVFASPLWASVVSLDLGADQWVVGLVPRAQIHSVSYLARNPDLSCLAAEAQGLSTHSGALEDFLDPAIKIIIGYEPISIPLKKLCQKRKIHLIELSYPRSFEELKKQILLLTGLFHQEPRGKEWIRELGAFKKASSRGTATFYGAHGLGPGNHTLLNDVLNAAGYDNLYSHKKGWTYNSAESLLTTPLSVLFFLDPPPATSLWTHLKKKIRTTEIPSRLTLCPYPPAVLELIDQLKKGPHA